MLGRYIWTDFFQETLGEYFDSYSCFCRHNNASTASRSAGKLTWGTDLELGHVFERYYIICEIFLVDGHI